MRVLCNVYLLLTCLHYGTKWLEAARAAAVRCSGHKPNQITMQVSIVLLIIYYRSLPSNNIICKRGSTALYKMISCQQT